MFYLSDNIKNFLRKILGLIIIVSSIIGSLLSLRTSAITYQMPNYIFNDTLVNSKYCLENDKFKLIQVKVNYNNLVINNNRYYIDSKFMQDYFLNNSIFFKIYNKENKNYLPGLIFIKSHDKPNSIALQLSGNCITINNNIKHEVTCGYVTTIKEISNIDKTYIYSVNSKNQDKIIKNYDTLLSSKYELSYGTSNAFGIVVRTQHDIININAIPHYSVINSYLTEGENEKISVINGKGIKSLKIELYDTKTNTIYNHPVLKQIIDLGYFSTLSYIVLLMLDFMLQHTVLLLFIFILVLLSILQIIQIYYNDYFNNLGVLASENISVNIINTAIKVIFAIFQIYIPVHLQYSYYYDIADQTLSNLFIFNGIQYSIVFLFIMILYILNAQFYDKNNKNRIQIILGSIGLAWLINLVFRQLIGISLTTTILQLLIVACTLV